MHTLDLILYVAALVLFLLATFNVPSRVSLLALGLACWVLVPLLDTFHTLGG